MCNGFIGYCCFPKIQEAMIFLFPTPVEALWSPQFLSVRMSRDEKITQLFILREKTGFCLFEKQKHMQLYFSVTLVPIVVSTN